MASLHIARQSIVRSLFTFAAVVVTALSVAQPAGATQSGGDASTNATTTIQVCEAMGGTAVVYTDMSSSHYTVIVECKGGALDGFNCIFDEAMVDCYQTRLAPTSDTVVEVTVSIDPLPEPTKSLPEVQVNVPIEEVAPIVDEPTATPNSDPIIDPVIDEPLNVDPVVNDGGAAPEATPDSGEDGGKDIGPGIDLDTSLLEPIVEPVEVVLY